LHLILHRPALEPPCFQVDTIVDDNSEVDESFTYWAEWIDAV
jgi:hypothetical protein